MPITNSSPSNYILVLNYNTWRDTIGCIESIINSSYKDYQIIVIDNNSTNSSEQKIINYLNGLEQPIIDKNIVPETEERKQLPYIYCNVNTDNCDFAQITKEYFQQEDNQKDFTINFPIIFLQTNKNLGFAGGNNVALEKIRKDSNISNSSKIFLLNPDTYIYKDTLAELNKVHEDFFICGLKIKNSNDREFLGAYRIIKSLGDLKAIKVESDIDKADFIYGGALYTNKKTLIKNGLLPEAYFLYWEETDWCYDAKLKGVKFLIQSSARVFDKVGTSIGRGYLAYYYYTRNGLYFYKKYFKHFIPLLLFLNIIRVFIKVLKGNFKTAKGIIIGSVDFFRSRKGVQV